MHKNNEIVLTSWPFPIAYLYKDMIDEKEYKIKFRKLIRVYAGLVKYISIICLTEYSKVPSNDDINKEIIDGIKKPTLGKWQFFIQKILNEKKLLQYNVLLQLLKKSFNRPIKILFSDLLFQRNKYVHPDVFPSDEESEKLYKDSIIKLENLFLEFNFLTKFKLWGYSKSIDKYLALMGHHVSNDLFSFDKFLIEIPNKQFLDVTPFMTITIDSSLNNLLIYEANVDKKTIRFILGDNLRDYENENLLLSNFNKFISIFKELLAKDTKKEKSREKELYRNHISQYQFDEIKHRSNQYSQSVYKEYLTSKIFMPRANIARTNMLARIDKLMKSDKNCIVIVGESGIGKSSLVCDSYTASKEKIRDHIVWFLNGRSITSKNIFTEFERFFSYSGNIKVGQIIELIKNCRKNEMLVLIFDGVNETDSPTETFKQIYRFIRNYDYSWIKIIVTIREFDWNKIKSEGIIPDTHYFLSPDSMTIESKLTSLYDNDIKQLLEKYSVEFNTSYDEDILENDNMRKTLSHPIYVRLLFEAYKDTHIPAEFNFDSIIQKFRENRRIRTRDVLFLEVYLMNYMYHIGYDYIKSSDVHYRTPGIPVFFDDNYSNLPDELKKNIQSINLREKLDAHINSDLNYDIDRRWCCKTPECIYYDKERLEISIEDGGIHYCDLEGGCRSELGVKTFDNRSTYIKLLSENILIETTDEVENRHIRFLYDKFFEYLMFKFILTHVMKGEYNWQTIKNLYEKAKQNKIFSEPLKNIIIEFYNKTGKTLSFEPISYLSELDEFEAYYLLREIYGSILEKEPDNFLEEISKPDLKTRLAKNHCTAAAYALLNYAGISNEHCQKISATLIALSECRHEEFFDDVAYGLTELKKTGSESLEIFIRNIIDDLYNTATVRKVVKAFINKSGRDLFIGKIVLLQNVILYGVGNFVTDENLQKIVISNGVKLIKKILQNRLLAILKYPLIWLLAGWVSKIYKDKGPLPCNYWEMYIQLHENRRKIEESSILFDEEIENVFGQSYKSFLEKIQSENGLITWYMISILPLHYRSYNKKSEALKYLSTMFREGSEMDKYVAGMALFRIHEDIEDNNIELETHLNFVGQYYIDNLDRLFLHPESAVITDNSYKYPVISNEKLVQSLQSKNKLYIIPWIKKEDNRLIRFYINPIIFHYFQYKIKKGNLSVVDQIMYILGENRKGDILHFGTNLKANQKYVIRSTIDAIWVLSEHEYNNVALVTIDNIINEYILDESDIENIEVYKYSIHNCLRKMQRYFKTEVNYYIKNKMLENSSKLSFLTEENNKYLEKEKEKLFTKSYLGNNIYQYSFLNSRELRNTFLKATKKAARTKNVNRFFRIYVTVFINWLKTTNKYH